MHLFGFTSRHGAINKPVKNCTKVRGSAKNFFSENTMEVGGWVQVSIGIFFGKSSQNSPKPVVIFCLYIYALLKVLGYYDLSLLSMSVMGFQKKVCM